MTEEAYPTADQCCEKVLWWMPWRNARAGGDSVELLCETKQIDTERAIL